MSFTKRLGDFGVIAFLYHAVQFGFTISQPFGDNDRYDLVLDNGYRMIRIQIKMTTTRRRGYHYEVQVGRRLSPKRGGKSPLVAYQNHEVDFVAVFIQPENTFYIVPIAALAGRKTLVFYTKNHPHQGPTAAYREAWHLLQGPKQRTLPWGQAHRQKPRNLPKQDPNTGASPIHAPIPEKALSPIHQPIRHH